MSKSPTKLPIPTVNPPKPRVTPIPIRPQPIPIRPQPNPNPNHQSIPMPQTRSNHTPINNNPIYNSIKENSPEMKFILSIGMDKPTWNNLLQFIPYLNDFIDCYSFFIVYDSHKNRELNNTDTDSFIKLAHSFLRTQQNTLASNFPDNWKRLGNIGVNPCDLLEKISEMNSEDNINFLRCLVSSNGDGKAFTLLVLRLKELSASSITIQSLKEVQSSYDRAKNCRDEMKIATILTSLPQDILSSIFAIPRMTYDKLISLCSFNTLWKLDLFTAVLGIAKKININNPYEIIIELKKICSNQVTYEDASLVITFMKILGERESYSTVYEFFMTHTDYFHEFLHCYASATINQNHDYSPVYLLYSFIQLNQDILDKVNIHSLFALPDERIFVVLQLNYPLTVNIFNNICICFTRTPLDQFTSILQNCLPILDSPSFFQQYANHTISISTCTNHCVQVSIQGVSDQWYRNQKLGWQRKNFPKYRLLSYGDQTVSLYYPLNSANPTKLLESNVYLDLQMLSPFVYECRSDFVRKVYCFTSEGLKLISNMGVFAISDLITNGLCINGNLLAYLQRNQFNLAKFHFKDDNSAILHPEYPVPTPLNTTSSFQSLFDLMEKSPTNYTTILENFSFNGVIRVERTLSHMKKLIIDNCKFRQLEICGSTSLFSIHIMNCPNLESIRLVNNHQCLNKIYLNNLPKLTQLKAPKCELTLYDTPMYSEHPSNMTIVDHRNEKDSVDFNKF